MFGRNKGKLLGVRYRTHNLQEIRAERSIVRT
jgi:hypothetical protein